MLFLFYRVIVDVGTVLQHGILALYGVRVLHVGDNHVLYSGERCTYNNIEDILVQSSHNLNKHIFHILRLFSRFLQYQYNSICFSS